MTLLMGAAAIGLLSIFAGKSLWVYVTVSFLSGMALMFAIGVVMYAKFASMEWEVRGYRWVSAEYEYQILDTEHHVQRVNITLEATRDGVDTFQNRYSWTGSGNIESPKVTSSGHQLMGSVIRRDRWDSYYIHLGRTLKPGEQVSVSLEQALLDIDGAFEPFLAKLIAEPVDTLVLRVIFPIETPPKNPMCFEQSGAVPSNVEVSKKVCRFNPSTKSLEWVVNSPIFGRRYLISWGDEIRPTS